MTTTLDTPATLDIDPRVAGIQVEAKLREWNLSYEYDPEFAIDEIRNVEWTQVRQLAHRTADKDTLAEFQTQMTQGAVYPPVVLMHPNVLVDGNHRISAAKKLHRKTFPAFVVNFNSVGVATSFNAVVNQQNGRRLTSDEAFEAARGMMALHMSDEAIARDIGRSPSSVRDMRRRNEFAERSAAIPEITKLAASIPQAAQIKLAQISHDPAFAEAVKVVAETRAPAKTVTEVVEAAKSARTDADAIDAVRAKRAEMAPAGPPPHRVMVPAEVKQSVMYLGGLIKLAVNPLALLDVATPERRTESLAKWTQVRDLAVEVIDLYGKQ